LQRDIEEVYDYITGWEITAYFWTTGKWEDLHGDIKSSYDGLYQSQTMVQTVSGNNKQAKYFVRVTKKGEPILRVEVGSPYGVTEMMAALIKELERQVSPISSSAGSRLTALPWPAQLKVIADGKASRRDK
jgi:hypothetical protein